MKITVTGALGYSGKFIAQMLLEKGFEVSTLTNSMHKENPFRDKIKVYPLDFRHPAQLQQALSHTEVLINTYWVRFNHKEFNHHEAVINTKILFDAAKEAGIKRIVHVSITKPDANSDLEYFKGKGELENYLKELKLSYAIIRPAVLFGEGDMLINNIAYMIKHLPVMGVFGDGKYKLQPIHILDFAKLIVEQVSLTKNQIINAIGPETYTYIGLIRKLMLILEINKPLIHVSPGIGYCVAKFMSKRQKDVTLTRAEIKGLMDNMLFVDAKPTGTTKLSDWAVKNKDNLGEEYANELKQRKA